MSFKDEGWSSRYAALGDEAEAVFESVYSHGFVRYGLNRPKINLASVPPFIRYSPDYLTSRGLVEVQGFGRDQTFKIKKDKFQALLDWQQFAQWRVDLFVWDSWNREYGWVRLPELLTDDNYSMGAFPEGKVYYAWQAKDLPVIEWCSYGDGAVTRQT